MLLLLVLSLCSGKKGADRRGKGGCHAGGSGDDLARVVAPPAGSRAVARAVR